MKWMFASDLHGSAYYCRLLLEALTREQAGRLLLLGDVLYHGPRNDLPREYNPKEVTALLNAHRREILSIRGNCDADIDQVVLEIPFAEQAFIPAGSRLIFATHGHVFGPERLPALQAGDILLCGHTHVPVCAQLGDIIYANPGSLSLPKEGSEPGYMTLEDGKLLWKTLAEGKTWQSFAL